MSKKADAGYHREATGAALETVKKHSKAEALTLFGACFCPFVQRAWSVLEYTKTPYMYREVDPYSKPKELLEVSPRGLVPGLRLNDAAKPRAIAESMIIGEYVAEIAEQEGRPSLLPSDLYARSVVRFQSDHVNRHLIPAFYRYLQAQEPEKQAEGAKEFINAIQELLDMFTKAENECPEAVGLWREGNDLSWTDVMASPWLYRIRTVLVPYRGFELPSGDRFKSYLDRLFSHPAIRDTCSSDALYLDSYARYAENRPNTSQVANAINSGRSLP